MSANRKQSRWISTALVVALSIASPALGAEQSVAEEAPPRAPEGVADSEVRESVEPWHAGEFTV